jgi:ABC-type nitrate/sulfonate/bicarbonate transport system substrate-binding protein
MRIAYALRKVIWWSCSLVALALLAGCGGGESSNLAATHPEAATTSKQERTTPVGETTVPDVFKDRGPLRCPTHSTEMPVTLDADPNAENIAPVMAEAEKHFENAGLTVSIGGPKNSARAVKYVALGIDAVGIVQQPQVLLATEEEGGAPLLAIGSVIKQNNAAMIWLPKSGITDVADLKGKAIGIPGVPFQEAFLGEILSRAGLTLEDVEVKRTNYKSMAALLEGRVDAIFGVQWNVEGAALEARGAEPVIKRAQSLGIPGYEELVVVAPAKCVAKHPAVYRDFMKAVVRGPEEVRKHHGIAVSLISENYGFDPRFRMRTDVRVPLKASAPLRTEDAHMNLARVAHLADWMYEKGILERKPPVRQLFTNDYVAP